MNTETLDELNRLRWDGRSGHYEVYFLKLHDPATGTGIWLRYTLTAPRPGVGDARCEVWAVFSDPRRPGHHVAAKDTFPIRALQSNAAPFEIRIQDSHLDSTSCRGHAGTGPDGPRLAWDLRFEGTCEPLLHFPVRAMYRAGFPKTKVLSPHPLARFSGEITVEGRRLSVQDAPGQQSHLWGSRHALRWAWCNAGDFAEDATAVFEGLHSEIQAGPLRIPHILLFFLRLDGTWHRFASVRQCFSNRSRYRPEAWEFELDNGSLRVQGRASAERGAFAGVTYLDPPGARLYCHNTGLADLHLRVLDRRGNELRALNCRRGAAFETVERRPHPGIPILL